MTVCEAKTGGLWWVGTDECVKKEGIPPPAPHSALTASWRFLGCPLLRRSKNWGRGQLMVIMYWFSLNSRGTVKAHQDATVMPWGSPKGI